MRSADEVELVLDLAGTGFNASQVAGLSGIPRSTVRDWIAGRLPHGFAADATACGRCGGDPHDFASLPPSYPYLLGMYLGDGCISLHARGVARMRIHLDLKYPGIIEETKAAIAEHVPGNRVHCQPRSGNYTDTGRMTYVIVSAYSKSWVCLFPQHGPGKKHHRPIALTDWQRAAVQQCPGRFLRGLIHSDGCRFINTGTNWRWPRYSLSNQSEDIRNLFEWACGLLGLHTTRASHTVYVSRKSDVAELDGHVGAKR